MPFQFTRIFILVLFVCFQGFSKSSRIQESQQSQIYHQERLKSDIVSQQVLAENCRIDQDKVQQYFGGHNIFLQQDQKYILVPALLFGTESSFKKQYQLQIVQNTSRKTISATQRQKLPEPSLFQIYPALQKLNTYNLTAVKGLNVTDCAILQVYFEDDDTPYIVCLRKSRQLQVHRIDISEIYFEFSFRVSYLWNKMNIVSTNQIFFYNVSHMQFYSYNKETDTVNVKEYKIDPSLSIKECETYIEDSPNQFQTQANQQRYYQICYTNNNQVSVDLSKSLEFNFTQIKKEFVIMLFIDLNGIIQLTSFQIAQKNSSSFNHIVGFDIIDSLEKVIMMCYNLYKINSEVEQTNLQYTQFVSSYCSIFKIYLDNNEMVLINRMQLQNTTFPLLETSLQISVMLTVATQASVTFYHLDVLKQRFEFVQQILVPTQESFNCYESSRLSNSYSSVSLTCAKNQNESTTVSFVMVFDQDLGKYIPVGNVFVGVEFFHSAQLIFTVNQKELQVLKANQQYAIFDYAEERTEVRVYEIDVDHPQKRDRYASIIMNPAQQSGVYVDKVLPLIEQINYDASFQLSLRGAFQGSNISYLRVRAVDEKGKTIDNCTMISQDRIYFYEYFLLVSVYINEECIRVIKQSDVSFYRILQIEKSRVDELNSKQENYTQDQTQDQYYYYTEICNKLEGSYVCELEEIRSVPNAKLGIGSEPDVLRVESTAKSKLIGIEYISSEDTFIYLYQLQNSTKLNSYVKKTYQLMFVDIYNTNYKTSSFQLFGLEKLLQILELSHQIIGIKLKNNWLIFEHNSGNIFCLLTHVKEFLLKKQNNVQYSKLKSGCVFSLRSQKNTKLRYFIQQNYLIVSQSFLNPFNKTIKITIYSILTQGSIVKKGTYNLVQKLKKSQTMESFNDDEDEFIGLYRQYIIIINSTTIRKFYLQVNLELVYQYAFNPDFIDRKFSCQGNSYPIKYVLFLEKYLIVQFDEFYQLYNIGQQLISIQIAANNFKEYISNVNSLQKQKFRSVHSVDLPKNVIINDAFLIEGDNILIYEKGHLVVAKYVNNPTLELGPFDQSHQVVETNLEVRLEPILDVFNFQDVYQQIMFKIIYFHYVVQKIAKNIKTLTVPSETQNYELEIWTFVFRGPIIEYYLSDTFDGQIVLKQHLTQVSDQMINGEQNNNHFSIIQYHKPYGGMYNLKYNSSHLLIEVKKTREVTFLMISEELRNTLFLKYLEIDIGSNINLICLLTVDSIVFIKSSLSKIEKGFQEKYEFWTTINHNISSIQDAQNPIPQSQIELLTKDQSSTRQVSFDLIIRFSKEIQNQQETTQNSFRLHLLEFSLDIQKNELSLQMYQTVDLSEEILSVKAVESELFVLTYLQNLIVLGLNDEDNKSSIEVKQRISLKDSIPASYRSSKKYIAFEIFNPSAIISDHVDQKTGSNMTMLLFSQSDQAFHIQFEVFRTIDTENKTIYGLRLTNIYASFQNFNFVSIVEICISSSDSTSKTTTKPPYLYFVALFEYQTSQTNYLAYFGYNYNFSVNGQVGYFKCGEEVSIQGAELGHIQNSSSFQSLNQPSLSEVKNKNYYVYAINREGHIEVQILNVNLTNLIQKQNNHTFFNVSVIYDKIFQVNTTIYMLMNYKKPPIVTYILLNARNFNTRAGIYTKFVFLKEEQTLIGFYISAPIFLVLVVGFGWLLKKFQPKEIYRRKKKPQRDQIIFSDTSRSSVRKEEKVICIEESDQEESSNNRQSSDEAKKSGNLRIKHKDSQQSSLLQSPFKSHYGSNYLEELQESEISHSEQIKAEFHGQQEKEILNYLIPKKGHKKNHRSSFS